MKTFACVAIALLALAVAGRAAALEPDDFRCFKSIDQPKPIRLEFVLSDGPNHDSYVIYEHGHGRVPVDQVKMRTVESSADRPNTFEMRWKETGPDAGGEYVFVSQGAVVSDFRYIRTRDGKVFRFEEDTAASGDHGCTWHQ